MYFGASKQLQAYEPRSYTDIKVVKKASASNENI